MSISPNSPNRPWVVAYGNTGTFTFYIPPGTVCTAAVIERIGTISATTMGGPTDNYEEELTIGGSSQVLGAITAAGQVDNVMTLNSTQLAALNAAAGGNLTVVLDATTATGGSPGGQDTLINLFLTFAATVAPVPTLSPSPNYNGGCPGGDGASGLSTNLYTLSGTAITEISTDALALQARVQCKAKEKFHSCELWYQDRSNFNWYLMPIQPVMSDTDGPRLTRHYQQPSTLDFFLPDTMGLLTPENLNSAYNYNQASAYDPLLDEARPILFRQGTGCWANLASGLTPTFGAGGGTATESGALTLLTDGTLTNYATGATNAVLVTPGTSASVTFLLNLGSIQMVRHVAARNGSRLGTSTSGSSTSSPTTFSSGSLAPTNGTASGVTMAIPAGVWTSATWSVTGTYGTGSPSAIQCYSSTSALTYHASGGFGTVGSHAFSGTDAATTQQLSDINAAAGGTMDVWANLNAGVSVSVTSFTLTLTGGLPGATLPLSVTISVSTDGVTYTTLAARPIGGAGDSNDAPGDWDENNAGIAVETAITDLDRLAQYVQFSFKMPPSGNVAIDELAVYGGYQYAMLGRNRFVGYLGDTTNIDPDGLISCLAADVMKRLADNNSVTLTFAYEQNTLGGEELADIAWSLLTSTSYWTGATGTYNAPFTSTFIGWTNGTNYTGFEFPIWQGQTNSMLGYLAELWHDIGWSFYADGNGVLQAQEPAYAQLSPDRVLTAASITGNGDLRNVQRARTGKNIRNKIRVTSGTSTDLGTGLTMSFDPNSMERYGERMMVISDPVLITDQLREKMAQSVLRDYSTRSQEVNAEIQPDFDTKLRQIHGLRAQGRVSMFPKASTLSGSQRLRELWHLQELTEMISVSDWKGTAKYIPYQPQSVQPPSLNSIDPGTASGGMATIELHFDPILDPNVAYIQIYSTTIGEQGPYTIVGSTYPTSPNYIQLTVSDATTIWYYLTAVDIHGVQSFPSQVLSVFPGSTGVSTSDYYVGNLAVSYVAQSGPDMLGAYVYQFYATWTAPNTVDGLGGFCQSYTHADTRDPRSAFDGLNPYLYQIGVAHWWAENRIPPGKTWPVNGVYTAGILDANWSFRTTANLAGVTLYFRMFTSTQSSQFNPSHPPCIGSNVVPVSIP